MKMMKPRSLDDVEGQVLGPSPHLGWAQEFYGQMVRAKGFYSYF